MKRFALLLAVLLLGSVVAAQTEFEPIAPGDAVEGTLTDDAPRGIYTFEGTAGTEIVLTLTSSDFDSFLALQASDNTVLAEDDDSAGQLNAQIVYTLEEDDTYIVVATSLRAYRYNNELVSTGDYTLTFETDGAPSPQDAEENFEEQIIEVEDDEMPPTGTITFDTPVNGTLNATDQTSMIYTFEIEEEQVVSIALESLNFDAYLIVRDPSGDVLARDDDGGDETDAFIAGLTLADVGVYEIEVTTFGNIVGIEPGSGDFTLTLVRGAGMVDVQPPPDDADETNTDADVIYGDTLEDRLTNDNPTLDYTFDAESGDIITVTMTSNSFDTYLQLFDEDGFEIITDDDSAGELNSRIGPFEISDSGTYTIVANSYANYFGDGIETGNFVLSLDTATVEALALGESVEATLDTDMPNYVYRVNGEAGSVLTINFDTQSYAAFVRMTGANGAVDTQSYGGPETLGPIILPEEGGYILTVSSYDLFEPMDFTLTASVVEPQTIVYGEARTDDFSETEVQIYTFDGQAGDVIDVTVTSESGVDTSVRLTTPSGEIHAGDDDSGAGLNPELIGVVLPEDGMYALLVEPFIAGDVGEYTVLVDNGIANSLDAGTQVIRVSEKFYQGTATFDGVAGETVQLSIRLLSAAGSEPYVSVRQDGDVLAESPIGNAARIILEFDVPADGLVQVNVEDYYYEGAVLELELLRVTTGQ